MVGGGLFFVAFCSGVDGDAGKVRATCGGLVVAAEVLVSFPVSGFACMAFYKEVARTPPLA